ncbi:putative T7SS-secreted protein [Microbacterium sp. 22303]|uniref:putative T7SS-secreted protein n=1 Tax=Microbacterium sp. 22303 TaxID=3453905 RepID=UPI003F845AE8
MKTHKGHEVAVIEGDASAISDRGTTITTLATQMTTAAQTLQDIKSGKLVGKGYAMDKIKDVVGDVHGDLDEAGRRYKPAGKTLTDYAGVLATVQSQMKTIVSDCETSEKALATAQTDADQANHALALHATAVADHPPTPDQEASSKKTGDTLSGAATSAQSTLATAGKEHDHNLHRFDTAYDTWSDAYDDAVNGLGDANKIGKDSRWENIAGVLAVISEWVSWIGLAIAVLGLIIGGPFFAIAALVVGVIALALTVALMFDGRKGWGDLAWAIVGVLPIGKLGQGFGKFFKAIPKQLTGPLGQIRNIRGISAVAKNGWKAGSKVNFAAFVTKVSKTRMTGPFSLAGLGQRFLGGANRSFTVAFQDAAQAGTGYGKQLVKQLPTALQDLAKGSAPSTWEKAWNVYKWADKGVAMSNGKPSGGLSPAKILNGLVG